MTGGPVSGRQPTGIARGLVRPLTAYCWNGQSRSAAIPIVDTNTMLKTFLRRLLDRLDSWTSKAFNLRLPNNSRPWGP
jgi:hypothetical protein